METPSFRPARPSPAEARRLIVSIVGLFVANGLLVGSYAGSLPALHARFAISSLGVALLLLAGGGCALVAMQVTGPWSERHGARRPAFLGPVVMVVGLIGLALSPRYGVAVACAACFGAGNGMMDVAMNALGVEVEQRLERVRMGLFHGSWSLGSFVAALLVVAFGPWSARVWPPVGVGLVLAAGIIVAVARLVPQSRTVARVSGQRRAPLPAATWVLGVMALCFGFAEGAGYDWASLHVAAVTGVSSSVAALGLACMSATMVTVRFLGDVVVARIGRQRAVLGSAIVATLGYACGLAAHTLPVVLLGWLLVGLGVGLIAPQIYGLAGHVGGPRMLGVVAGFGYTSFLACPALVGTVSASIGLQRAMVIPLAAAVLLGILSLWMPRDPDVVGAL